MNQILNNNLLVLVGYFFINLSLKNIVTYLSDKCPLLNIHMLYLFHQRDVDFQINPNANWKPGCQIQ